MRHPHVLQLIMDSLRYWVTEMHVDGFRFDLASTLARELHDVDRLSAFFDLIQQDPVVSGVKLIAEPWDVGEGGYQVGNFPPLWTEWNGKYRDTVRDYWRGADGTVGELAARLSGSSDLYESNGRRPFASINFVTCHDGFTLRDLVSYDQKHNEANGEDNRDGNDDNRSWNGGVEGPTDDPAISARRARQQRNFLATLLLSQGVPMVSAGDELGRTQHGNNNAYCQDNELSWLDWEHPDQELLDFTRWITDFRERHAVFRRRRWLSGRPVTDGGLPDAAWFNPGGDEMEGDDWTHTWARALGLFLNGEAITGADARGEPITDDSFLVFFERGRRGHRLHAAVRALGTRLGQGARHLAARRARPRLAPPPAHLRARSHGAGPVAGGGGAPPHRAGVARPFRGRICAPGPHIRPRKPRSGS